MAPVVCRSALYVPGSNAKAIEKARTLACDAVILDLEDGVAPEAKNLAREQTVAAVRTGDFGRRTLIVRVNARETEWGRADLDALADASPDAILLPKINGAADVHAYQALLGDTSHIPLWAMIETAKAILVLNEIGMTAFTHRLCCLVMGTNDLAKELGARLDTLRQPFLGMLGFSVAAARAHGMTILDGVFNSIDDTSGFDAQCRQAVDFGFDGKTLIHPRQIEPCNRMFTPDAAAIAWADRIVSAFDDPVNADKGAICIDGTMVERLHLTQAHRTLASAATAADLKS